MPAHLTVHTEHPTTSVSREERVRQGSIQHVDQFLNRSKQREVLGGQLVESIRHTELAIHLGLVLSFPFLSLNELKQLFLLHIFGCQRSRLICFLYLEVFRVSSFLGVLSFFESLLLCSVEFLGLQMVYQRLFKGIVEPSDFVSQNRTCSDEDVFQSTVFDHIRGMDGHLLFG